MIEKGDGTFERRINNSQCPRCRCLIVRKRDDKHRTEYECTGCKMKIIDVKGENE